jgi:hypothetical protein
VPLIAVAGADIVHEPESEDPRSQISPWNLLVPLAW